MTKSKPSAKKNNMPPLCGECGTRFVWFEDRGLCGLCGDPGSREAFERRRREPPAERRDRSCSLPGCNRKHSGHGLCNTHLIQARRDARAAARADEKDEGQTWRS